LIKLVDEMARSKTPDSENSAFAIQSTALELLVEIAKRGLEKLG
jgi:hypothetical protein